MPRDTPENYAAARKLHALAREFRGRFLNSIAVIEHDIAKLLTEYFCTSDPFKQELFFNRVACRLSLEQKRVLLVEIVKNDYPRYWEEHDSFINDLKEIQEFRNKLAHSILDVSDEALARPLEEGVSFVQWNKGAPITERVFNEWCVRANMVLSTLAEIKTLLPYKEHKRA
jgi:hypothetical protein